MGPITPVARHSQPILEDLRARGLDLVRLNVATPLGTDLRPLYQAVLEWLPRVQDPLTLTICLSRLLEPAARPLVKKNRERLLSLTRLWNDRLREDDRELTLSTLAQCVMKAALARDLPEILDWAKDQRLPLEARLGYVFELQRFARKHGVARDALVAFVNDEDVGGAAVWALARSLKVEALPILRAARDSGPHPSVRRIAAAAVKKVEARSLRVDLPDANPAMLPQGYASMSIEFDTDCFPELLSTLESEIKGRWLAEDSRQLALSANQLKRGRGRFHVVPMTLLDGQVSQVGFGLFAEDEDVIVVEIHFDARFREPVAVAFRRTIEKDSGGDTGAS